jgi:transcription elongation factor GreB
MSKRASPEGRVKNYITPAGYARLKAELLHLLDGERPELVKTIAWAAANGDRSENADYIYGKRRLREIDKRIRFLTQRLDAAEVVDSAGRDSDQVFFGATVTVSDETGAEASYTIVGADESDASRGFVSWVSPIAKALLKSRVGDVVRVQTPKGLQELEVLDVRYNAVEPR